MMVSMLRSCEFIAKKSAENLRLCRFSSTISQKDEFNFLQNFGKFLRIENEN